MAWFREGCNRVGSCPGRWDALSPGIFMQSSQQAKAGMSLSMQGLWGCSLPSWLPLADERAYVEKDGADWGHTPGLATTTFRRLSWDPLMWPTGLPFILRFIFKCSTLRGGSTLPKPHLLVDFLTGVKTLPVPKPAV